MERSGGSSSVPTRKVAALHENRVHQLVKKPTLLGAGPKMTEPELAERSTSRPADLPWHNARVHDRHLRCHASILVALAVIASACGTSTATPTPTSQLSATPTSQPSATPTGSAGPSSPASPTASESGDQAIYAGIEAQVEDLRALRLRSVVNPILLDEQGVRDWMTRAQASIDHEAMAAQSRLLAHLGLLPAGASLEQLMLDLNSGQAIGFYDVDTKQLYLLSQSGAVGPEEQLTFSHEFTHALQDQNFGLDKLAIDTAGQSDRDLARTALPEGDATLAMTQWATAHMSVLDLLSVSISAGLGPQTDQLTNAPAILREELMFPYEEGLSFVEGIYSQGGWAAVDRLYSNPPDSTSQILHPELYAKGVAPVILTIPGVPSSLGAGWTLATQDTMGELELRVWLEGEQPTAAEKAAADSAASSWAGDRIGLYEGPNGQWAVVLRTVWRGDAGRDAFASAVGQTLDGLSSPSVVCGDAIHADVIVASDPTILGSFATCQPPL